MSAKSKIILDTFISQKRFLRAGRLGLGVLNSNVMRPAGHGPHNQSWMLKSNMRVKCTSFSSSSNTAGLSDGLLEGVPDCQQFRIAPDEVKQLMLHHEQTAEQVLTSLVKSAAELARPPISGYHVGAVGLCGSGAAYVGINLEFQGTTLAQSVHAEQFLLVNALRHGEASIDCVALSAAPCGHCRQFYSELRSSEAVKFVFGAGFNTKLTLSELLPENFGPKDLLSEAKPLLLEDQFCYITLKGHSQEIVEQRKDDTIFMEAANAAVEAARKSYAPYTGCVTGAALITTSGLVVSGGVIESAAYNPTLPPLQAALVNAVIAGIPSYSEITEIVLVEASDALVSHAEATDMIRKKIAPESKLTILNYHKC